MVPVNAPRLSQIECRNERERRFLQRLNERAKAGGWRADSWSHTTDHVQLVIPYATYHNHEPRADYFGDRLLLGGDETGQYVTELDPADPTVKELRSDSPEKLADATADFFENCLRRRRRWTPGEGWNER